MIRALLVIALLVIGVSARADDGAVSGKVHIQDVTSPGGIHAWLVEAPTVPVLSVEVAFIGGSRLDPAGKAGLAAYMASLLDEGAGTLDDQAFKQALEDKAIRMGFGADLDTVSGSFLSLEPYTKEAFNLFALALTKPRFDPKAVERVRAQILVALNEEASDPGSIASKTWFAAALKGHPYALPTLGSIDTIRKITAADIVQIHKQRIGRDRLMVAVVGPIDAKTLGRYLDEAFGSLPKLGKAPSPPPMKVSGSADPIVVQRDIPQSVVNFGGPGIKVGDPDFIPGYVMNYVLGGGGFASRLMEEIREKRGLTYGISTSLASLEAGGLFGGFSSRNEVYGQAHKILMDEIKRMASGGVTDQELNDAKTYLTGSYVLRFDTNDKIAGQLIGYQVLGYDIDYINRRNDLIKAVTKDDIARVAGRLLKPEAMTFVVVGKPNLSEAGADAVPIRPKSDRPAEPSENMQIR